MRRYGPLVAIAAAAIALAAILGVLRNDAHVPTPGDVVEGFLERVVDDRYEKAASFLADGVGPANPAAALSEWKREVEDGLGRVRDVRGETEWISGDEAEATGVLVAGRRERRLRFTLRREEEGWRIAGLDEFWGDGPDAGAEVSFRVREARRD